eukprot:gene1094-47491_t
MRRRRGWLRRSTVRTAVPRGAGEWARGHRGAFYDAPGDTRSGESAPRRTQLIAGVIAGIIVASAGGGVVLYLVWTRRCFPVRSDAEAHGAAMKG